MATEEDMATVGRGRLEVGEQGGTGAWGVDMEEGMVEARWEVGF